MRRIVGAERMKREKFRHERRRFGKERELLSSEEAISEEIFLREREMVLGVEKFEFIWQLKATSVTARYGMALHLLLKNLDFLMI